MNPAHETKLARLVRVLREITDSADYDVNVKEARELLAQSITETDVAEWIRHKFDSAGVDLSGMIEPRVIFDTAGQPSVPVMAFCYTDKNYNSESATGQTIAEALAALRKRIPTGITLAAQKREQAAKLIAEADAIDPAAIGESKEVVA